MRCSVSFFLYIGEGMVTFPLLSFNSFFIKGEFMKQIMLLVLVIFGSFAMAEEKQRCPLLDEIVRQVHIGSATAIDLAKATLCEFEKTGALCNTRIGINKDVLDSAKERFRVGELTIEDVQKAEQDVADVITACEQPSN